MGAMQPFIPKGQINIYRFVPLDPTYQNTLYFPNRQAQLNYFQCVESDNPITPTANTILKLSYTGTTFTRQERQYVQIATGACNVYDCNYMSFQNRDFGEMWFFAFITDVEYVNDYCTRVYFEIDVMQTFMWNYELRECFVEREHSWTDKKGDSLTPENVPAPVYKNRYVRRTGYFNSYDIMLVTASRLSDPSYITFGKHGGVPFGGTVTLFDSDPPFDSNSSWSDDLPDTLRLLSSGNLENIAGLIVFPSDFATDSADIVQKSYTVTQPTDIDNYTPVNNKLFTYPYNFLLVDCLENTATYRYEFFNNPDSIGFVLEGVGSMQPQIRCTPIGYNVGDSSASITRSAVDSLTMTQFPFVFYTGDNWANWFGQHGMSVVLQGGLDLAQLAFGVGSGNPQIASTALTGGFNLLGQAITAANAPPTARSTGTVNGAVATRQQDFYFISVQANAESAKIIDDYFTMFGYAVNQVKVPNIRYANFWSGIRRQYNYIKCREMSFHWEEFKNPQGEGKGTSVPARYMQEIIRIYQAGITFWSNPEKVGRYDELKMSNRPPDR